MFEREIQIWLKVSVEKGNHVMYQDEHPQRGLLFMKKYLSDCKDFNGIPIYSTCCL